MPERDRTDAQWDEIVELEIQLAPGNRVSPGQSHQGHMGGGGGNPGGGGGGKPQKKFFGNKGGGNRQKQQQQKKNS